MEVVKKKGFINHLDDLVCGYSKQSLKYKAQIQKGAVIDYVSKLNNVDKLIQLGCRATSFAWHQNRYPYLFACASKRGELTIYRDLDSKPTEILKHPETGASGAYFSMKFDKHEPRYLYRASLDSTLNRLDIEAPKKTNKLVYHDTGDYFQWFTAMDYSPDLKLILGGDTKGNVHCYTTSGEKGFLRPVCKKKILHCEFNPKNSNQFVTSCLDGTAKLFDIRKMEKPLQVIENEVKGANIATFNSSGDRLLTSDQEDKVRVYSGPCWNKSLELIHPHRQFQHLTPIKARWHPLADIFFIGRYPKLPLAEKIQNVEKPVDFFDGDSGELLYEYLNPCANGISSISMFSPLGDMIAQAIGRDIYLIKMDHSNSNEMNLDLPLTEISSQNKSSITARAKNAIRGVPQRRTARNSTNNEGPKSKRAKENFEKFKKGKLQDDNSDSDEEIDLKKKRKIPKPRDQKKK